MSDYLRKKAIEDARHIYEDYFPASRMVDSYNNIRSIDVQVIPKHSYSTCSRCLNLYPHNENNYSQQEGFVCDNCLGNNQTFN